MNKPNFREMTRKQLRDYILQNRGDTEAIHALTLHVQSNGKRLNSVDELQQIIQEKRSQGLEP
ncbi:MULTISPECIES: hypothetical protein [unclassified Nostoc]|uniref:DUF6887 family protein n=1 Tax=unclassified Nostoc TaxID=2593658 RepID=UPI001D43E78F|nr:MULTISPECIES: hypothetical protein [unclassified Nostoc]MBN4001336.1 hypothetical protein [Nostoc sp. LPT]MDZ8262476.1 hypothetical protein [Nostoc sp. ChiQUE01b]